MSEKKPLQAWFDAPELALIDRWRREQPVIPSIADAMRTLVRRGLAATSDDGETAKRRKKP